MTGVRKAACDWRLNTWHNDIQLNVIQHINTIISPFNIMTLSLRRFSVMKVIIRVINIMTISKRTFSITTLSIRLQKGHSA